MIEKLEATTHSSPKRWIILALMSAMNLFVEFVGFSITPRASTFEAAYPGFDSSDMVIYFLWGSVSMSLFIASILQTLGLTRSLTFGSVLLLLGNLLKSGFPNYLHNNEELIFTTSYVICGASQPFFQISMLEVVDQWFPINEKAMATGVIACSGDMGTATAYILTTAFVTNASDCPSFLSGITVVSGLFLVSTVILFSEGPYTKKKFSDKGAAAADPPSWGLYGDLRALGGLLTSPLFLVLVLQAAFSTSFGDAVGTYVQEMYADLSDDGRWYPMRPVSDTRTSMVACGFYVMALLAAAGAGWALSLLPGKLMAARSLATLARCHAALCGALFLVFLSLSQGSSDAARMDVLLVGSALFAGPVKSLGIELASQTDDKCTKYQLCQVEMFMCNLTSGLMLWAFDEMKSSDNPSGLAYDSSFLFYTITSAALVIMLFSAHRCILTVLEGASEEHNEDERKALNTSISNSSLGEEDEDAPLSHRRPRVNLGVEPHIGQQVTTAFDCLAA